MAARTLRQISAGNELPVLQLVPEPSSERSTKPLPRIEWIERHCGVLQPCAVTTDPSVLSLNLSRNCAHRCSFCCVRATDNYRGDEVFYVYRNTAEALEAELHKRRVLPRAVYLCPSGDPFPPFSEVQAETVKVVEILARFGIQTWLMTRGFIRPSALKKVRELPESVRVIFAMTTLNRHLRRVLEPLAAPTTMRLRQIAQLRQQGISVRVHLEPLIPGLTDTRENLTSLLDALSERGVSHITAGYLYLRPAIVANLRSALEGALIPPSNVLDAFEKGPILTSADVACARYAPKHVRQRGYALLMSLAAARGITVSLSGVSNPDFAKPRPAVSGPSEPTLFPCLGEMAKS